MSRLRRWWRAFLEFDRTLGRDLVAGTALHGEQLQARYARQREEVNRL